MEEMFSVLTRHIYRGNSQQINLCEFKFPVLSSQDNSDNPDNVTVLAFVDRNFGPEGTEFEEWEPEDWDPNPEFLNGIKV